MTVRPIDGNDFMRRLTLDTSKGHYGEFMDGSEVAFTSREIAAFVEQMPTLTPPNEPLTLEVLAKSQLLQMLGEKVEVIRMGEMCQAEWATVRSFGDCKTDSGCSCCHELYGKTWIAYRRPPEGEEET